jgi:hypothetical protein
MVENQTDCFCRNQEELFAVRILFANTLTAEGTNSSYVNSKFTR